MKTQRGAAMVEFAIIASLFFVILFGIIEFARAMFVYNALVESTRRGARVAAVCPVSNEGIDQVKRIAIFNLADGTGTPLLGLSESNITVSYFDKNMTLISTPIPTVTDTDYDDTAFVRVQITNYFHRLFIPLFGNTLTVPDIQTTLPSESLGRTGPNNPVIQRCCYGVCTP